LTRSSHGFGFVHRSVMEWLVADTAATELREGNAPTTLATREMSDLMTDFFCDLASHAAAARWADRTRSAGPQASTAATQQANATRIRARLRRRGDHGSGAGSHPAHDVPPVELSGQDLRDQDIAAFALPGNDRGLRGALLRDANLAGKRLA